MADELCSTCHGNGVLKIHHGVKVCPSCSGKCWAATPPAPEHEPSCTFWTGYGCSCRAAAPAPPAGETQWGKQPDMTAVCARCGGVWGEHFGPQCPDGEGKFTPMSTLRERLAALVEELRIKAKQERQAFFDLDVVGIRKQYDFADFEGAYERCADRLAALLSADGEGQPRPSGKGE